MKQTSIEKLSNIYNYLKEETVRSDLTEYCLEILRAEAEPKDSKSKFDYYNYVARDKFRPVICCVYHDNGFKVASDAHILVAVKEDYPEELEGKMIGKGGENVQGIYPKWRALIPEKNVDEYAKYVIDAQCRMKFAEWLKERRLEVKAETGKGRKWEEYWRVKVGPAYLKAEFFEKFLAAMDRLGTDTILVYDERRPVVLMSENGYGLLMPLLEDGYNPTVCVLA